MIANMGRVIIAFALLTGCMSDGAVYGQTSRGFTHDCELVTDAEHIKLVGTAAAAWSGVCFDVTVTVGEPIVAEHHVLFRDSWHGSEVANVGAVAIYEGEASRNGVDLLGIVVHELGHHYGLHHSDESGSVMAEFGPWGSEPSTGDLISLFDLCQD